MTVAWTVVSTVVQMAAHWADQMAAKTVACLVGYSAAGSVVTMVGWWECLLVAWLVAKMERPRVDLLVVSLAAEKAEPMGKMMVVVWAVERVSTRVGSLVNRWADESE